MSERGRVGTVARALGFAGLLPAAGAACWIGLASDEAIGTFVAQFYPLIILSFLGGMWWGFAMRRSERQGALAIIAVLPSLAAFALFLLAVASLIDTYRLTPWVLIATGVSLLFTLLVDRHLVRTGEAPEGWMALRIPLSIGLGGLTIVSGVLLGLR